MNIITISREFGSGGRELGKRLAELLGYDYYDKEIISIIAERHGLDEKYVEHTLSSSSWNNTTLHFRHSFSSPVYFHEPKTELLIEQKKVIDEIASQGKNFVIVGRNADILLANHNPFNIFVCADIEARIKRCKDRAEEGEKFSDKELKKNILRIDKNRKLTRYLITEKDWGMKESYHLIVNTTDWEIKKLAASLKGVVEGYFEQNENK